jgi:hypothetical protein
VIAAELTAAIVGDAEVLPDSLERLPAGEAVAAVAADGAYDTRACHRALLERRATALIPPRAGVVAWSPLAKGRLHPRTAILNAIRQHGPKVWK